MTDNDPHKDWIEKEEPTKTHDVDYTRKTKKQKKSKIISKF